MQISRASCAEEAIPLKVVAKHPKGPGRFLRCAECWSLRDASAFSESVNKVSTQDRCAYRGVVLSREQAQHARRLVLPAALLSAGECWQGFGHTYFWIQPWQISFPTAS